MTKEEIENLATPPPGMFHRDLYLLECCLFRFGITTVADVDDDHFIKPITDANHLSPVLIVRKPDNADESSRVHAAAASHAALHA